MIKPKRHFAICVNNSDYEASLILRKIYEILPDETAARDGLSAAGVCLLRPLQRLSNNY
jgi:hypothetical protein